MQKVTELNRVTDTALGRLTWARGGAEKLLAGVPEERLAYRAGGAGNHALWVMGHLATTDDQVLAIVTGARHELPDRYRQLFSSGSDPTDDARDYPSRQELLDAMRAQRRRMIAWVESLDEESFNTPTPESFHGFAPDFISTAFGVAAHEMLHVGQVAAVRSALGLPRLLR